MPNEIKIFSKNGKDATADREPLHANIRDALRIGQSDCRLKRNCILLAEMVLYSDKDQKILPFSKIRKHIKRSGSFLGTLQDSLPHAWEHLMLVFFDVLVVDDEPVMRQCLQKRRSVLRDLVQSIPGRSLRSQWTLLSFKDEYGIVDLKQAFARSLANRQEGLILKPLGVPYFPLYSEADGYRPGYFIKLKKDYLADMGGQRDLGDFAIIGASFDPQLAPKTDVKPLHWTHFHIGCVTNKDEVQRLGSKPNFKLVGCLGLEKQISKSDLKYLNQQGRLQEVRLGNTMSIAAFTIEPSNSFLPRMTSAFKTPFVVELLGSGYTRQANDTIDVPRHPRITKIHQDRTWEDAVSISDLARIAREEWDAPDPDALTGHARDVGLLVEKYSAELGKGKLQTETSMLIQGHATTQETTQETTQQTTQRTEASPYSQKSYRQKSAVVQETQESLSQGSTANSSCPQNAPATFPVTLHVRESSPLKTGVSTPKSSIFSTSSTSGARRSGLDEIISPPAKHQRMWTGTRPLSNS
jgi:DNA ligase-4